METLRVHISNAVNEVQRLLKTEVAPEAEVRLRQLRSDYFYLWQQVILQSLDNRSPEYTTALQTLRQARDAAETAQTDLAGIEEAIRLLEAGAKAVRAVVRE